MKPAVRLSFTRSSFTRSSLLLILLSFITGCSTMKNVKESPGVQQPMRLTAKYEKKVDIDYLLYLPENYNGNDGKFPLVLFLHGAGERGSNIEKVKVHGIPKHIDQGEKFPFIAVSPQCPELERWQPELLNTLLDEIIDNYRVDESRVYVTGISMGGYGTWALAMEYPERFAAIAPVCGGGDSTKVCRIQNIPVWDFHGKKDNVVPIEESERLVRELKKCGGNVRFTVYPDAGHDSWTETYKNKELYDWLLSQKRK